MNRPVLAVVALAVVVQLAVPAFQLRGDEQRRWGWQMYAGRSAVADVAALDADGQRVLVGQWAARMRPEVRWDVHAPPHLCGTEGVVAVEVTWSDGRTETTPCST